MDTWVVQSVVHQALNFSSCCDLRVMKLSPMSGSMLSRVYLRILFLPLHLTPCAQAASLSLSLINKSLKKIRKPMMLVIGM